MLLCFLFSHISLISPHFHQYSLHYLPSIQANISIFSADTIPTDSAGKRQAVVLERELQLLIPFSRGLGAERHLHQRALSLLLLY